MTVPIKDFSFHVTSVLVGSQRSFVTVALSLLSVLICPPESHVLMDLGALETPTRAI